MKFKAIHTKADYEKAVAIIDALMDKDDDDTNAMEELEVWSILVEAYEEEHFPIESPDPIEAIQFAMEQRGTPAAERAAIFGGKNRMSEVLSGKRALSIAMMRRAHLDLGVPAEVVLLDYKLPVTRSMRIGERIASYKPKAKKKSRATARKAR